MGQTSASSSELLASRFAPCNPVQATSPMAYKPGKLGRAVHVRLHAAALVMRRRHDRDRLLRHVDAVAQAGLVNVRETAPA